MPTPNNLYPRFPKCVWGMVILMLWVGIPFSLQAQDKLFLLDNSEIDANIAQVGKKIIYSRPGDRKAKKYKIPKKKVGLIRYKSGLVHVFGKNQERQFAFQQDENDKLFLASGRILPIQLKGIYADYIEYVALSDPNRELVSAPKSGVVALIQRRKDMLAYVPIASLAQQFLGAEEFPIIPAKPVEPEPVQEPSAPIVTGTGSTPPTQAPPPSDPLRNTDESNPFLRIDEEEFKRKALDKTRRLSQYISLISNKSTPIMEANQAVSQAITLFIGDSCIVQVSSVKRPSNVRDFFIRQYLENIKLLKYDRVDIEWVDINYVGDVRKGPDGNYYGTVTFVQKFRGIRDDRVVYEDRTYKRIEVVLKTYGKNIMGTTEELWDVFLSNIKVEHTTSY